MFKTKSGRKEEAPPVEGLRNAYRWRSRVRPWYEWPEGSRDSTWSKSCDYAVNGVRRSTEKFSLLYPISVAPYAVVPLPSSTKGSPEDSSKGLTQPSTQHPCGQGAGVESVEAMSSTAFYSRLGRVGPNEVPMHTANERPQMGPLRESRCECRKLGCWKRHSWSFLEGESNEMRVNKRST
jgi:hypothetical protein